MKNRSIFLFTLTTLLFWCLASCDKQKKQESCPFVINEIMTSNHTGLQSADGMAYDWIEVKNMSDKPASLKGCSLVLEKPAGKNATDEDSVKTKEWEFPELEVKPGECVVVFASKLGDKPKKDGNTDKKDKKPKKDKKDKKDKKEKKNKGGVKADLGNELHACFKLPSKGGKIKLMYDGEMIQELNFGEMEHDQCYRRLADKTYELSYEPTPGFENNSEGYERYNSLIEKQRKGPLRVWEIYTRGYKEGLAWVEIKNISDQPVDLIQYCLSTSNKDMSQWTFPEVQLQPGQIYVVNARYAEFKTNVTKAVMLTKDGVLVDGLCAANAPVGVTVGRMEGKDGMFYFSQPTKGKENTTPGFRTVAEQPTFETQPGVHAEKKKLKVILDTHGYTVHYTTDGTTPNTNSPVYKDSITITATTTIRAYCEGDSTAMASPVATSTYIFGDKHTIPVMNITVNNGDLYNYANGIYANGPGYGGPFPHTGANFWKDWWKNAHIELFDSIDGFSADCQLAIFGGFSRALAKKSFKIRFKDTRGPRNITCDLFGDGKPAKYRNFVLRSGSQDISGIMARDEFFTSLMQPECPNLLIQSYRPVALYVNGEYFGLYYIREKIDKRFVARKLDVSDDNVTIMMSGMYCEEGKPNAYRQLMNYVRSHNLAETEHYEYVKSQFDLEGLIDYKLGQIYSCNSDIGNVRFVRSDDKKSDKKWHVVYYDLDATWGQELPAGFYLRANGDGRPGPTVTLNTLIERLLANKEFRQLFLERLSLLLHKTFSTKNVNSVFDRLIATIKPEMPRNCERWPNVLSYKKWEKHLEGFRKHFDTRPENMLNSIRKVLSITPDEEKKYFADLGY